MYSKVYGCLLPIDIFSLQAAPVNPPTSESDTLIIELATIFAVFGLAILVTKRFRDQQFSRQAASDKNVAALFERVTSGKELEDEKTT